MTDAKPTGEQQAEARGIAEGGGITDEAVEAAAGVIYGAEMNWPHAEASAQVREYVRGKARAALTAAAATRGSVAVTDEAVEVVAGFFARSVGRSYGRPVKDDRVRARSALEAALPLLGLQQVPTAEQIAMRLSLVRFSDEESDRMIELTMREAWPLADAVVSMFSKPAEEGS